MQISNELEIQSFQFTTDKPNMLVRAEEIDNLAEIDAYCKNMQAVMMIEGSCKNC